MKGGLFGIFGKWADDVTVVAGKEGEGGGGGGGGADPACETSRGQGAVEVEEKGGPAGRDTSVAGEGTVPRVGRDGDPTDKDTAAAADEGSAPPLGPSGDGVRRQARECATPLPAKAGDNSGSVVLPPSSSSSPPPATGSTSLSPAETAWSLLSRGRSENVRTTVVSGGGGSVGSGGGGGGMIGGGDGVADVDGDGGDGAVVLFQLLMQRWELRPWVVGPRTLVATKEQVQCVAG